MQNIEIKTRLHDIATCERRLAAMGAKKLWTRRQTDAFYAVPRGWLKLREQDGVRPEIISYIRSIDDSGPRESDYDVIPIGEAASWKRLLGRVLNLDRVVEKTRTLWVYEHTRVHLDRVEGLGDFLELETMVLDISHDEARDENRRVIWALALNPDEFLSAPYRDLES
jgi:predicted adenylyl cyclase CyaB